MADEELSFIGSVGTQHHRPEVSPAFAVVLGGLVVTVWTLKNTAVMGSNSPDYAPMSVVSSSHRLLISLRL